MARKLKKSWGVLDPMVKMGLIFTLMLIPIFGAAYVVLAGTATIDLGPDVASGTMPPCLNFHGTGSAGTTETITLPFNPSYVKVHPNSTATASGAGIALEWFYGATAGNIVHNNGSTVAGWAHSNSSVLTVSGNVVTIPIGKTETAPYNGRACR